jgi:hypothetical protein
MLLAKLSTFMIDSCFVAGITIEGCYTIFSLLTLVGFIKLLFLSLIKSYDFLLPMLLLANDSDSPLTESIAGLIFTSLLLLHTFMPHVFFVGRSSEERSRSLFLLGILLRFFTDWSVMIRFLWSKGLFPEDFNLSTDKVDSLIWSIPKKLGLNFFAPVS